MTGFSIFFSRLRGLLRQIQAHPGLNVGHAGLKAFVAGEKGLCPALHDALNVRVVFIEDVGAVYQLIDILCLAFCQIWAGVVYEIHILSVHGEGPVLMDDDILPLILGVGVQQVVYMGLQDAFPEGDVCEQLAVLKVLVAYQVFYELPGLIRIFRARAYPAEPCQIDEAAAAPIRRGIADEAELGLGLPLQVAVLVRA